MSDWEANEELLAKHRAHLEKENSDAPASRAATAAGEEEDPGWWLDLSLDELREEFACLEELECQNQAAVADAGHHCAEKSTDGIWGLINERDELREERDRLRGALEKIGALALEPGRTGSAAIRSIVRDALCLQALSTERGEAGIGTSIGTEKCPDSEDKQ